MADGEFDALVYLPQSELKKDKIYIGTTGDLERRSREHNSGGTYTTKWHQPYRIVYYEAYLDKQDALERERKLKHHGSVIGHLKKRTERSLNVQAAKRAG